jgi:hypothetical protein
MAIDPPIPPRTDPPIPPRIDPPIPPREALADVRVRAPTRGNRRLEGLLEAVNSDEQLKAWWHVSAVNATRRLGMSDHSWVHIQIVLNIALRLSRLLFRAASCPASSPTTPSASGMPRSSWRLPAYSIAGHVDPS